MADLIIHGPPQSSYVMTARLACEEKGITHELADIEFGSQAHLGLHPFGKVPIMTHGDFRLYETAAIIRYVDEAFDGPALQPADVNDRAVMEQLISAYVDYYYPAIVKNIVINRIVVPMRGGETDEQLIADSMPAVKQQLAVVDQAVSGGGYIAGGALSLADLMLLPAMFWLQQLPEGEQLLPGYPALGKWIEAMTARPSFGRALPPRPGAEAAE